MLTAWAIRYDARYCVIHYNLLNNKLSEFFHSLTLTMKMAIEKDKQTLNLYGNVFM